MCSTSSKGRGQGDGFGRSLAGVGDLDGDGSADFAVAAQRVQVSDEVCTESGYVRVHSGRTGNLLHRLSSVVPDDSFGGCVAGGGDIDGDGAGDVIVGSGNVFSECSTAHVFSGRTGELLADISAGPGCLSVAIGPDQDGDGRAEALSGEALPFLTRSGTVGIRVGGERQVARIESSFPDCEHPVWTLSSGGDADGDGVPDLLVGRIHCGVDVFSGRTRKLLYSVSYWSGRLSGAASSLDWIGDVDGDVCSDFVVAANVAEWGEPKTSPKGFVKVYSGRTGLNLSTNQAAAKGVDACRAGDVDRDGIPDLAVYGVRDDTVRVISGCDSSIVWEVCGLRR